MFFVPFVMKKAIVRDNARPIHAACNSQSARLIAFVREYAFCVVSPNPLNAQTTKVIIPGTINAMAASKPVGTFSFSTRGKEMLASVRSKGRLFGEIYEIAAPMPATIL